MPYYGHVAEPWSDGSPHFRLSNMSGAAASRYSTTSLWIFAEMITIFNALQIILHLYILPERGWRILFTTGGHSSKRSLATVNSSFALQ